MTPAPVHVRLPAPPSAMPSLLTDPALVESCGVHLRAACTRVDDLGTFLAGPARVEDWSGLASRAYHDGLEARASAADALSLGLRRVAARVLDHAEVLARLSARHDELVATSAGLAGGIDVLRHDVAAALPDRITVLAPVLQARADAISAHVAAYEAERERWEVDLATAEREMVAVLARLGSPDDAVRRLAGVPDPADEALASMPPPGSSPLAVRAWWGGLAEAARAALLVAAPAAIGNLAGIPALARHRANTVRLRRDLADLRDPREPLAAADRRRLRSAEAAADALERAAGLVDARSGEAVPVRLYLYDPSAFGGDGAVAVAVGDPDVADDVSVLVPGLGTDAADVPGLTDEAITLYEAARAADGTASHASLAWVGYDAPDNLPVFPGVGGPGGDVVGVLGEGMAERGGAHLSEAVEGLRAERQRPPADLTVIGHSYGSTTVGAAAHDHGLPVDDLVVLGSPGLGGDVDHARDLGLEPGHVWAGASSRDPVAALGGHGAFHLGTLLGAGLGTDPAGADFGAIRFQAEWTSQGPLDSFDAHSAYLDHGSESLHHVAEIVTGHHDDVARAGHVSDPWWRGPVDPERGRAATSYDTGGP